MNNKGPRNDPNGTPIVVGEHPEDFSLILTPSSHPLIYFSPMFEQTLYISRCSSFARSRRCLILSELSGIQEKRNFFTIWNFNEIRNSGQTENDWNFNRLSGVKLLSVSNKCQENNCKGSEYKLFEDL